MRCNLSLLHHFLMLVSFYCFIFENVVSLHRILVFRFVCLSILHFWSVYTFVRLPIFFLIHAQVLPRYQWVIQSSPCCVYLCLWMWKIRSYIHMNERTSERNKERKKVQLRPRKAVALLLLSLLFVFPGSSRNFFGKFLKWHFQNFVHKFVFIEIISKLCRSYCRDHHSEYRQVFVPFN